METQRQKKINALLQQEITFLLQGAIRAQGVRNLVLSVSKVAITVDLSLAKVYLSVFPANKAKDTLVGIKENKTVLKHDLAKRLRNDLRKVPDLAFYLDDSLEYIYAIEDSLKRKDNPLK
ncbi:MAG: ribosome-binding factor A [Flavobacteriaceae bacterium]|mgnify:CR=1 FL=1|nr:ribosome-binding factor A [Flavobacteriaceae bacterium]|tara:strand:- start:331 stop:690 length:360 start_codon:yes stop_codon:yes gene_type:complete